MVNTPPISNNFMETHSTDIDNKPIEPGHISNNNANRHHKQLIQDNATIATQWAILHATALTDETEYVLQYHSTAGDQQVDIPTNVINLIHAHYGNTTPNTTSYQEHQKYDTNSDN